MPLLPSSLPAEGLLLAVCGASPALGRVYKWGPGTSSPLTPAS